MLKLKVNNKWVVFFSMIISVLLLISGCGNSDSVSKEEQEAEEQEQVETKVEENVAPVMVTDLAGKTVEFTETPERIIAFSTGEMSIIQALDGNIVGRPTAQGEVEEKLKDIPEVGSTNEINIEKVAALSPDLVIAHRQLNAKDIPALEQLGVKVLQTGATSLDEINQSIELLGKVMNKNTEAEQLIQEINNKIKELSSASNKEIRSLIIFGVPGNWMVALPNSLSGNFLEAVGGYNIAKDYPKLEKFPQYAQLNIERIVESNPDIIFLITPGSPEAAKTSFTAEMEKNPSWKSIAAVKNEHFITLPNSLFGSNPGAKVIESLNYLHKEIQSIIAK